MGAVGKRCFVSNLAWKTSWQDLKDKFREVGNVVYANVHQTEDGAHGICFAVHLRPAACVARRHLALNRASAVMPSLAAAQDGQKAGGSSNMRRRRRYNPRRPRKTLQTRPTQLMLLCYLLRCVLHKVTN